MVFTERGKINLCPFSMFNYGRKKGGIGRKRRMGMLAATGMPFRGQAADAVYS